MEMASAIFEALAHPVRRRILAYLSKGELSAGAIADRFDISKPTISRHLNVLEHAGLVSAERRAQFIYYSLNRAHLVANMYDFLADFCPKSRVFKRESRQAAAQEKRLQAKRKKEG
jgi:DNA-binding transcriptional ArsR family regulator